MENSLLTQLDDLLYHLKRYSSSASLLWFWWIQTDVQFHYQ